MHAPRYFDEQVGRLLWNSLYNGCQLKPVIHFCNYRDAVRATFIIYSLYQYCNAANFYSHSGRDDSEILKTFQSRRQSAGKPAEKYLRSAYIILYIKLHVLPNTV
jgi:hypothetical protein